jgi:hypothetical protein
MSDTPHRRIFITGRQRYGTTVFRQFLCSQGCFDCDEVFHADLRRHHRFYSYVLEKIKENNAFVHPLKHGALFEEFIALLHAVAKSKPLVLDVKYSAFTLIPTDSSQSNTVNFLIQYIKKNKSNVVHIIRKNKLRVIISEAIAMNTGRWSCVKSEQLVPKEKKYISYISPTVVLNKIQLFERQDAAMAAMLQNYDKAYTIFYEEMFASPGKFSKKSLDIASACLEKEIIDTTPEYLLQNPEPTKELLGNFDEVAQTLSTTPYAWMLDA